MAFKDGRKIHTAVITFHTATTNLIDQTFKDIIIIQSIEIMGTLFTNDKITVEMSDQKFEYYGPFLEYFDLPTKYLKITPTFVGNQIGLCKIVYEGARKIKSTYIGTSQPLVIPTIRAKSKMVVYGQLNVTTAGTRVQLTTIFTNVIAIKAKPTNTGYIYVGDNAVASTNGYILSKNEVEVLPLNASEIYIDASVNGEGVSFIGWV